MQEQTENKQMTKEDFYNSIFSAEGKEAKRDLLKSFSNTAKMMMELDPDVGDSVNEVILKKMYQSETHSEFHSFKGWKELGFGVKKGSKSFFIWSKPRKFKKKQEEEGAEDKEYKAFGIAYLFSNAQVEPLNTTQDANA